jgi:hypothetical protein
MRFLMKAHMPNEAANAAVKHGELSKTIKGILDELKPEAAYFGAEKGCRTAFLILNIKDNSEIPKLAEPWFLAFGATIDLLPVMTPGDLAKAAPDIEAAAKKYA